MQIAPLMHRLNSLVCFVAGITLNGVLAAFVMRDSESSEASPSGAANKAAASRILLQTCVVDILYLLISVVVQPVS